MKHTLTITTPDDRSIVMTRSFTAPRELVFDAHTKPELVMQWMGVSVGFQWETCEIDLRVGGHYRYVWVRGDFRMGMGGEYLEVDIPKRITSNEKFDHAWYEGDCIGTLDFIEINNVTTVTMTLLYDTKAIRDAVIQSPMDEGVISGYDILERVLDEIQAKANV